MQDSHTTYNRAKAYLFRCGRELDQQRFRYQFEDGDTADVVAALRTYQNSDGGFGRALEPDLRAAASSVIATTTGFDVLREVDAPKDSEIIADAGAYLYRQYDAEKNVWPIIPPQVEDAPHAPWWFYAESEQNFGGFRLNPRAAVLGHLFRFSLLAKDLLLEELLAEVVSDVKSEQLDMHDFFCVVTLLESPGLSRPAQKALESAIRRQIPRLLLDDPAQWGNYGLLPLDVAPRPDSLFADAMTNSLVEKHLDHLVQTQESDGSWPIPWSWASVSETAWAQAERDWKSYMIVGNLRRLHAYGRL